MLVELAAGRLSKAQRGAVVCKSVRVDSFEYVPDLWKSSFYTHAQYMYKDPSYRYLSSSSIQAQRVL